MRTFLTWSYFLEFQTRGMTTGGCQATLGMRGDVTVDGDSLVGDGGEAAATTGTTTVQSPTAGYSFPDYTPPPNTGSSSSRRKRKSTAVMRRGIPSTSPRSIPQVSPPDRNDLPIDDNMRYYCSICDKTFSRQFSWKVHMNVHRGIFPYTCSVCGKGFTSHINLKGHLVQHTNRREFKCAACGKEFIYKRGLNAHIPICKGTQNGDCMYEQTVWCRLLHCIKSDVESIALLTAMHRRFERVVDIIMYFSHSENRTYSYRESVDRSWNRTVSSVSRVRDARQVVNHTTLRSLAVREYLHNHVLPWTLINYSEFTQKLAYHVKTAGFCITWCY